MFARCSDSVDGWQYRVPDSGAGAGYPGVFSEGEAAAGSRMKSNAEGVGKFCVWVTT